MNGFLLIDKPEGKTSFDVCYKVRKALGIKRVGHTGTLDPFANGLLVVAVGKATKLIPYLEKAEKSYKTTVKLGATSDTLDPESEEMVLCTDAPDLDLNDIQSVVNNSFSGEIQQIPPKYSALKVDGKRAYDLARKGEEVIMKTRPAFVHSCSVTKYSWPYVDCDLTVAAGFYVRSFARDLGFEVLKGVSEQIKETNNGGYCVSLRRTMVGDLSVNQALSLDELSETSELIDPKDILTLPSIELTDPQQTELSFGRAFVFEGNYTGDVLLLVDGQTVGLGYVNTDGRIQPKVVF